MYDGCKITRSVHASKGPSSSRGSLLRFTHYCDAEESLWRLEERAFSASEKHRCILPWRSWRDDAKCIWTAKGNVMSLSGVLIDRRKNLLQISPSSRRWARGAVIAGGENSRASSSSRRERRGSIRRESVRLTECCKVCQKLLLQEAEALSLTS